jgi:hypothetical protein
MDDGFVHIPIKTWMDRGQTEFSFHLAPILLIAQPLWTEKPLKVVLPVISARTMLPIHG